MNFIGSYPSTRLRRLRQSNWILDMVREHDLTVRDLILPVFVCLPDMPRTIESLPGIKRYSLDELPEYIERVSCLGILAIALFPVVPTSLKTLDAQEAINPDNLMCQAIRLIKKTAPHMGIIADVALDPYTPHGHDGLLRDGQIVNDETIDVLCQQAHVLAMAGVDVVAPSDMMDGRIGRIRSTLDAKGYTQTLIMSYSVKYASAFYGPFRQAVDAKPLSGLSDKRSYQIDPLNTQQALREVAQDVEEGADMVIIKPGLPYLDIIHQTSQRFPVPVFAYQVSGEYAMLKAAAQNGWLDERRAILESLMAFKRAGARGILTYGAMEAAQWLKT